MARSYIWIPPTIGAIILHARRILESSRYGRGVMGTVIALIVTFWLVYFITKRYKPQPLLYMAGIVLMFAAVFLGVGKILPPKESTGLVFFDAFEFIKQTFSSRTAGLGLNIMAVGGFVRYMEHIGASKVLVKLTLKPLLALRAPYVIMTGFWVVGVFLGLCIPSASGLAMLLIATGFPVLIALGVSRMSATACIASTLFLDWSPSDIGTVLLAQTIGLEPVRYWTTYQLPVAAFIIPITAIAHYFVQKRFDKKEGHVVVTTDNPEAPVDKDIAPKIYALLPPLPLAMILIFSLVIKSYKMDVVKAMFISLAIGMILEFVRKRDGKQVFEDIQIFFNGMGIQLANVITLIVGGETFAKGLMAIGAIDTMVKAAQNVGFGAAAMILVVVVIVSVAAVVMGSGNAPFFAFAALTPSIAAKIGVPAVMILLPIHFAASIARTVSPIAAVIVTSSGLTNVSPFDLVKRTAIPMAVAMVVHISASFFLFYR